MKNINELTILCMHIYIYMHAPIYIYRERGRFRAQGGSSSERAIRNGYEQRGVGAGFRAYGLEVLGFGVWGSKFRV